MTFPPIKKLLAAGFSVAPSDGGWLASYSKQGSPTKECGIFVSEAEAERACVLWSQGYRFDQILKDYERRLPIDSMTAKWGSKRAVIRECIVLAGGAIRPPGKVPKAARARP